MRYIAVFLISLVFLNCGSNRKLVVSKKTNSSRKSIHKILKSHDVAYKLRMAEQFFAKKNYHKAQIVFEDVMPYYKGDKIFEDIYYKYAYCAYNQKDYLNAENIFKTYLEMFPNSTRAEEIAFMRAYSYYRQSPKPELDQTSTLRAISLMQNFINAHPASARNEEAWEIIQICRRKLEVKEYKAAQLYYDMGHFRAAGVAFTTLLQTYPDSDKADEYKLMVIKSYFRFAEMSIEEKKPERFEQVITHCYEFIDRFPDSKLRKEVNDLLNVSQKNLNSTNNEQVKTSA